MPFVSGGYRFESKSHYSFMLAFCSQLCKLLCKSNRIYKFFNTCIFRQIKASSQPMFITTDGISLNT
ncbi:hypothetical protein B0I18_105158 [Taibaiella chishuiensis]|uniref:Uncharacterized protein n=1 Tax=Taibaiella chishuiensis TaxID=1434707 RepID=A0A2P8D302_9BACT|nr:hypothetical protein B0I18_105158 [Taibaiella chishuiensis]